MCWIWEHAQTRWQSQWKNWFGPQPLGRRGESAGVRYLKKKGYLIVAHSQTDRLGEIDIVAIDGRTIVFVEVKTRRSHEKGHPADAVDENKQHRLTRLALAYLKRHNLLDHQARFDVLAVTWPKEATHPHIQHFISAFEAHSWGPMFG